MGSYILTEFDMTWCTVHIIPIWTSNLLTAVPFVGSIWTVPVPVTLPPGRDAVVGIYALDRRRVARKGAVRHGVWYIRRYLE